MDLEKLFQAECHKTLARHVDDMLNSRWQKQGSWEVNEGDGVCPVYCGENGREAALSYARQRTGYGHREIHLLDYEWNVAEIIGNEDARPLV